MKVIAYLLSLLILFFSFDASAMGRSIKVNAILWELEKLNEVELLFVADNYDKVIIGSAKESYKAAQKLKKLNDNIKIYAYLNARNLEKDSPYFLECDGNDGYFAHDKDGERINNSLFDSYLADVTNPMWGVKLAEWASKIPEHIDGIFLDDARPILRGGLYEKLPYKYDSRKELKSMKVILETISRHYNGEIYIEGLKEAITYPKYLDHVDGGVLKGFVFDLFHKEKDTNRIYEYANILIIGQNKGVTIVASVDSDKENLEHRLLAVACYMLGADENSTYNFIDRKERYSYKPQFYPEYLIDLGDPIGSPSIGRDLKDTKTQLFIRRYTKGLVVINPWRQEIRYKIPGNYDSITFEGGGILSQDGKATGSLKYTPVQFPLYLPPRSAVILKEGAAPQE